ncbi:insulin receptor substrate 2-B-like [Toxotes jaculatrix]|uniref:insulin receptor substrate 2-B-like n=1 Tax=Toxotes jaculatrix TaxID=941984 RepID=UPI001B3A8AF8|nr:insulin receptor substrate 2-B-like [Toxotes jaculatrix]XP_040888228.1 insulin receptor substrate 2-B-like [Toxotes jaculatrix]
MNEMAEGHDGCGSRRRPVSASSSPLSSPCCSSTQTWLPAESPLPPPWMSGHQLEPAEDSGHHHVGMQTSELPSSHFYEELFCTCQTSVPLVQLAGALVSSSGPHRDVVKEGYLGKLERNHRRYFVLRAGSHTGPSRLEWYKSREKFTAVEKSASKAALFGSSKQGVIYLRCCLGVSRTGSSRKGHMVALYAKDQTMVLVVEDQQQQDDWYLAIKRLMEEERKDDEHGEGFDEEDDGYCTLPPAASFKEVWPVSVKPRGLGRSKSLTGETRLCLTATALILVRVGACSDLRSVTIPLLSVRRFGHLDGSFFLELGRSAPDGPGEIWMEARDQGNSGIAQNIHEAVRDTVRALRALPDFSRSPASNHNQLQALLISKRSRTKHRDKLSNVRPPSSLQALPPRSSDVQTSPTRCYPEPHRPERTEPESTLSFASHLSPVRSQQRSVSETGSYMEMRMQHCGAAACRMEGWELGDEQEGLGYMMMSPQVSHSSSVLPQDDYVTMASPHKHHWPPYASPSSSLQTSVNSSSSDGCSPVHPSRHQTSEHSRPHWQVTPVQRSETDVGQSQTSISCSSRPLVDDARVEKKSAEHRRHSAQTRAACSPVGSVDVSDLRPPSTSSGPGYTRPVQSSPRSDTGRPSQLQAVPDQSSVRRHRLPSCLPSCLQSEDTS